VCVCFSIKQHYRLFCVLPCSLPVTVPAGERLYVTYGAIHRAVSHLAGVIQSTGQLPDAIVAIGTGGLIPGRILKTFLNRPMYFVTVRLYDEQEQALSSQPHKVQWIDNPELIAGKHVVVVDEVWFQPMCLG
jgi:hypoxanthine phosphoribosyltransferase